MNSETVCLECSSKTIERSAAATAGAYLVGIGSLMFAAAKNKDSEAFMVCGALAGAFLGCAAHKVYGYCSRSADEKQAQPPSELKNKKFPVEV